MSAIRPTGYALTVLRKGTRECLRQRFPSQPLLQVRATSSPLLSSPQLACRSAVAGTPSNIQRRPRPRQIMRSSPARRGFAGTSAVAHGHVDPPKLGEELHVTFVDKEGDEHTFEVSKGDNLLDIAQENDLEMEGACGGSCACSTCHVIVEDGDMYDKMSEPDDDENDMLDLAFGLTETSRLGCQVVMSKDLDGLRVKLPSMTRNLQASDFSNKEKSG